MSLALMNPLKRETVAVFRSIRIRQHYHSAFVSRTPCRSVIGSEP
jgi:hypothetical protein